MTTAMDRFNSSLLELSRSYYKGPFHQKLSDALSIEKWEKDLGKACMVMFPTSVSMITPPTMEMIQNYGNGDIGSDYLVNLFIDDRMGRIISAFRNLPRGEQPNFESLRPLISELSFLDSIQRSSAANEGRLTPLFYMKLIYDGFARLISRKRITKITFPVEDTEALSFLGISSLLSGFLNDVLTQFFISPGSSQFNLLGIGPYTSAKKPWLMSQRFFPIEGALENEDFQSNELFGHFVDFNSRYIAEAKPDLPVTLSRLLSSSSFIWDQEIFGVDPQQLEAMSEEQRLELLMKNKNGIIERCFEHLLSNVIILGSPADLAIMNSFLMETPVSKFYPDKVLHNSIKQEKQRALRIGNQIEGVLQEIETNKTVLSHTVRAKEGTRASIREISDSFGDQNDTQFEAEVLSMLEKTPIQQSPRAEGLEKIVFDLANKYRREVLLEAAYKEKINEQTETLRELKKELGNSYSSIGEGYLKLLNGKTNSINALLQVHTVFSYFLFNKDIFPHRASFSGLAKKAGAKKIFQFLGRNRRREQRRAFRALQEASNLEGTIQSFLSLRSNQIFEQFKEYQSIGVRALTQQEIRRIADVSKAIQKSPQDISKFERLEKILEKILVDDEAFVKNCHDLSRGISSEKVIKLQTHMNACLLFTEGESASDATGLKRSLGFRKLHREILKAMEGDSVQLRALQSGQQILEQLQAFEYPPEVVRSFDDNVRAAYRSFSLEALRDIEMNIQPLNVEEFPQVKQKRIILEEIKKKIFANAPSGESGFLSEKHRPPRSWNEDTTVPARDAIRNLFQDDWDTYTRKYLQDHFETSSFRYGTLIKALKAFASRERIDINILSPGVLRQSIGYLFQNELDLAVLIGIYEEIRRDYNSQVESLQRLHITELARKQTPGIPQDRASVFDNTTLFRYYKSQKEKFSNNQQISEQLYEQFLPLFLTSYLADAANLNYGRSFFVQRKLDAIREILPGIDRVYGELDAFLISKGRELAKLEAFFRESAQKQEFLEAGFLEQLRSQVGEIISGPIAMIGESALTAAIVGIGILGYTRSPTLAVIGGMAISAFWMTQGKPIVKDIFVTAQEVINNLLGIGYSPSSINDYILDLFKVALKTEVKLSQSDRQGELELQHLFSNALFLQEEFSILRNSRYSLFEFKNRLHMLLPNALKNVNFSTMILNLFFKFNEPLFLSSPGKLLKNTQHSLFLRALKDYCQTYSQMINEEKKKFLQNGHVEEECDLTLGKLSPFRDYLAQRARDGGLILSFPRNSTVHRFLNAQDALLENTLYMPLEESQIVQPGVSPNNIRAFLRTINEGLSIEDQFLGAIRPVILRSRRLMTPQPSHLRVFDQGLKSSYFLLRYALDTARRLENLSSSGILSSRADSWLSSTNETGQSIFLSPLFRESFSLLMRTAELAASSGIPEGQEAFRVLAYIQGVVDRYLKYGNLGIIPMQRLQELENSIRGLIEIAQEEPQIIFPIFMENERNQTIQLPFAVWAFGQESLANEMGRNDSAVALRDGNSSNIVYLSNQAMELFFTSQSARGFALSPMVMNILEQALKQNYDQVALQFLGVMNERDQARLRSIQQPERFLPNLDQIRESVNRNMARRRGQPLALMPPEQVNSPLQQAPEMQQQPMGQEQSQQLGNAPQNMVRGSPQIMGNGAQSPSISQSPSAQINQQQQMMSQPAQQQQGPIGVQDQSLRPQQEQQQQQSQMVPLMMGGQSQMPQPNIEEAPEQQMMEEQPIQQSQPVSEPQGRNLVMVGANGSSGSFSGGGGYGDVGDQQPVQEPPSQRMPPIGPPPNRPYRGPMNMDDFQQYQEEINQPQGFPYGKAAAIGGGLMLGAALLSQLMKKDEKKRRP